MSFRFLIPPVLIGVFSTIVSAQISPGELSKAHEEFEGIDHCTQCHEQGQEITGKKCVDCHTEISEALRTKRGYHFLNASSTCINCHKEHLGRNASITQFDNKHFDHRTTGFLLAGKHASVQCERCHSVMHMKDPTVVRTLHQYPHQTYLGLRQRCSDCHNDRHGNTLGTDCQNCHTAEEWNKATAFSHAKTPYPLAGKHLTVGCMKCHETLQGKEVNRPLVFTVKEYGDCKACHKTPHSEKFSKQECRSCHAPVGWSVVSAFDHSTTAFTLIGKHSAVSCEKCHAGLAVRGVGEKKEFATKPFKDCTPCHASPHAESFSKKPCSSCHTSKTWASVPEESFDHSMTAFPLRGKHAVLNCEKCHLAGPKQSFKSSFKLSQKMCVDCHEDKHQGQFVQAYANDCSQCHTEAGFSPSTYSFEKHQRSRFILASSHLTVPCRDCHVKQKSWVFQFDKLTCESCHKDHHEGVFIELMKERSCDVCHTEITWKKVTFDHARTKFPLVGQHTFAPCDKCHIKQGGTSVVAYRGTSSVCADCHTDPHAGQFADKGKTDCANCHTPISRHATVFQHNIQSTFILTGAHGKVECGACHKPELRSGKIVIRYKPLSQKCESCHQGK